MGSFIRKPSASTPRPELRDDLGKCFIAEAYPALIEFVSMEKWDDDTERQTCSFLITYEEGMFKLWLNDRALRRAAWLSGGTVADVLASAEQGLQSDCLAWRKTQEKNDGRRRK